METCFGHGNFGWKTSVRLSCHTIAERKTNWRYARSFSGCPTECFPPYHTPHNIITWPRHVSWKHVFYPLLLFHICSEYFSAWYYAGSVSLLPLDSLQKQHQFPVLVARENAQINSRAGVFLILLILMKVKNHFQNIKEKKRRGPRAANVHSREDLWVEKFHGENLPLASAQFSLCNRPKL